MDGVLPVLRPVNNDVKIAAAFGDNRDKLLFLRGVPIQIVHQRQIALRGECAGVPVRAGHALHHQGQKQRQGLFIQLAGGIVCCRGDFRHIQILAADVAPLFRDKDLVPAVFLPQHLDLIAGGQLPNHGIVRTAARAEIQPGTARDHCAGCFRFGGFGGAVRLQTGKGFLQLVQRPLHAPRRGLPGFLAGLPAGGKGRGGKDGAAQCRAEQDGQDVFCKFTHSRSPPSSRWASRPG